MHRSTRWTYTGYRGYRSVYMIRSYLYVTLIWCDYDMSIWKTNARYWKSRIFLACMNGYTMNNLYFRNPWTAGLGPSSTSVGAQALAASIVLIMRGTVQFLVKHGKLPSGHWIRVNWGQLHYSSNGTCSSTLKIYPGRVNNMTNERKTEWLIVTPCWNHLDHSILQVGAVSNHKWSQEV